MRDRLIELIVNADTYDSYECKLCFEDKSCEYCNAEKLADYLLENNVVCLPCKVGSTVYATALNPKTDIIAIHRGYIGSINIRSTGKYIFICHEGFDDEPYFNSICGKFADFGKTVFLTREEAERALKGEKV